jgi:hypothetical protein
VCGGDEWRAWPMGWHMHVLKKTIGMAAREELSGSKAVAAACSTDQREAAAMIKLALLITHLDVAYFRPQPAGDGREAWE